MNTRWKVNRWKAEIKRRAPAWNGIITAQFTLAQIEIEIDT
jgi:hypothetical protein